MKESFIIEIDVDKPLTNKECISVMKIIQARLQGYHCDFPEFIKGKMTLRYIEHSEKRIYRINEILNESNLPT